MKTASRNIARVDEESCDELVDFFIHAGYVEVSNEHQEQLDNTGQFTIDYDHLNTPIIRWYRRDPVYVGAEDEWAPKGHIWLVRGPNCWGKDENLDKAIVNARRSWPGWMPLNDSQFTVFCLNEDMWINEAGTVHWSDCVDAPEGEKMCPQCVRGLSLLEFIKSRGYTARSDIQALIEA